MIRINISNSVGHRYNIFDLPWRMVDAEGAVTRTLYDVLGRPIAVKDALLHVSHTEYDAAGRVHATRDELGRRSVMHYDNAGRIWKTVDPLDHYVTYGYDNLGRLLWSVNELGYATSYEYLDLERKTVMHDALGGSSTTFYDALGRVEKRRDALGHETRTEYDVLGRQSAMVDAVGFRTEFGYDKDGRQTEVTQIVNGEHHTSRTEYDERGLKTADVDARGNRTEYEYDAAGRQDILRDATQVGLLYPKVHRYEYNSVNRLVKTTDPLGHITRYEYDGEGRQSAIVDAKGNRTEMVYNILGQLRERHDALGAVESFAYDAVGNQVSRTDARGQITTYDYDALNRLAVKHLTGGAVISFTYDAMGQQLTMTDASGTTTNTYDALGRVSSEVNGRGNHLAYEYDAVGHRTVLIDPEGGHTLYAPDATGQLTSLTDPQNGVTVYVRDALGRELTKTLPNGVVTQHAYDAAGRETLREERDAQNTVLARYVWLYDAVSLKTQVTELDGAIVSYNYDATYQLTREQRTGSAPYLLEYAYDAAGNRTGLTRDGVTATSTYNAANQLTEQTAPDGSVTTFLYDADGNLSSESAPDGSGKSYFFDGQDQLIAVEMKNAGGALAHRSEFSYDDRGRLVKSSEFTRTGTSWVWQSEKRRVFDGLDTVQERSDTDQVLVQLTRDGNIGGIVSRTSGTNTAFFGYDGNGNVTLLSDSNGSDVGRYRYDGFGNALEVTGSSANENDYRFSTKELHAPSGLYYYGFRFYSPALGRWINRDPIRERGGVNLYKSMLNNAVNLADSYGLDTDIILTGVSMNKKINIAGIVITTPIVVKGFSITRVEDTWGGNILIMGGTRVDRKNVKKAFATILTTKTGKSLLKRIRADKKPILVHIGSFPIPAGETKQLPSGIDKDGYTAHYDDVKRRGNEIWINPSYNRPLNTIAGPQVAPLDLQILHELGHPVLGISDDGPKLMALVNAVENPYRAERTRQLLQSGALQSTVNMYAKRNSYGQ